MYIYIYIYIHIYIYIKNKAFIIHELYFGFFEGLEETKI